MINRQIELQNALACDHAAAYLLGNRDCWLDSALRIYFHSNYFMPSAYEFFVNRLKRIIGNNGLSQTHINPKNQLLVMAELGFSSVPFAAIIDRGSAISFKKLTFTPKLLERFLRYGPLWVATRMHRAHDIVVTGISGTDIQATVTFYDPAISRKNTMSLNDFNKVVLRKLPPKEANSTSLFAREQITTNIWYYSGNFNFSLEKTLSIEHYLEFRIPLYQMFLRGQCSELELEILYKAMAVSTQQFFHRLLRCEFNLLNTQKKTASQQKRLTELRSSPLFFPPKKTKLLLLSNRWSNDSYEQHSNFFPALPKDQEQVSPESTASARGLVLNSK